MKRHSNESKTRLDSAQKEYYELKEQAQEFDTEELQNLRYDIRTDIESETISELQKIYGGSFVRNIIIPQNPKPLKPLAKRTGIPYTSGLKII